MNIELFRLKPRGHVLLMPGELYESLTREERERNFLLSHLLLALQLSYWDAVLALGMYEEATERHSPGHSAWTAAADKQRQELGQAGWNSTIEQQVTEMLLLEGHIPPALAGRARIIQARSFVYSLDMASKLIRQLENHPDVPAGVKGNLKPLLDEFKDITSVRDSIQHQEQRIQGKGRQGKGGDQPIPRLPGDGFGMTISGEASLYLDSFDGHTFFMTVASGQRLGVDITDQQALWLKGITEAVLDAFQWAGPPTPALI